MADLSDVALIVAEQLRTGEPMQTISGLYEALDMDWPSVRDAVDELVDARLVTLVDPDNGRYSLTTLGEAEFGTVGGAA